MTTMTHVDHGSRLFYLNTDTVGVFVVDGKSSAALIPKGAIIELVNESLLENWRLVNVRWNGSTALVFAQDIYDRGKEITNAPHKLM